jgi:hypothetical protein
MSKKYFFKNKNKNVIYIFQNILKILYIFLHQKKTFFEFILFLKFSTFLKINIISVKAAMVLQ